MMKKKEKGMKRKEKRKGRGGREESGPECE